MRIDFSFAGTLNTPLSLDPKEFHGLSVQDTARALKALLGSVSVGVVYYPEDITLAAEVIQNMDASLNAAEVLESEPMTQVVVSQAIDVPTE